MIRFPGVSFITALRAGQMGPASVSVYLLSTAVGGGSFVRLCANFFEHFRYPAPVPNQRPLRFEIWLDLSILHAA